jgi:hypothetical protein
MGDDVRMETLFDYNCCHGHMKEAFFILFSVFTMHVTSSSGYYVISADC